MALLSFLIPVVNPAMAALQSVIPAWLVIVAWSAVTAVVVMLLYRRCSPQDRVAAIAQEMGQLQKQMLSLQVSSETAGAATLAYLRLSLQRIGITLVPVILSSLPALLVWAILSAFYQQPHVSVQVLALTPAWMGHWLTVFLVFSLVFSLILKFALRIR